MCVLHRMCIKKLFIKTSNYSEERSSFWKCHVLVYVLYLRHNNSKGILKIPYAINFVDFNQKKFFLKIFSKSKSSIFLSYTFVLATLKWPHWKGMAQHFSFDFVLSKTNNNTWQIVNDITPMFDIYIQTQMSVICITWKIDLHKSISCAPFANELHKFVRIIKRVLFNNWY